MNRSEISDETNESRAFSFFPLMLNIGTLIASFVGGSTANIAERYPWVGDRIPFLRLFPFFLPSCIAALFPLLSGILATRYMKETLPPHLTKSVAPTPAPTRPASPDGDGNASQPLLGSSSSGTDATLAPPAEADEGVVPFASLLTYKVNAIMFSFGVLSLMGTALAGLVPLHCFTPIADGGLGFTDAEIGWAMSSRAISTIVVQLFAFPWLQRRVGTYQLYRALMVLWIPTFLGLPVCNWLAREGWTSAVWVTLVGSLTMSSIANMTFGLSFSRVLAHR